MRIAEKTLELTICSQLSVCYRPLAFYYFHYLGKRSVQPLWFGLTQKQEARAGFDAATRLGNSRLLILQFKAGHKLKSGNIRFMAPHAQLQALKAQVQKQTRLVLYVLPVVTKMSDLLVKHQWVLDSTWFLDVADIPTLGAPSRKSGYHNMRLDPESGVVEIRSDPVEVNAISARFLMENIGGQYVGGHYDNFETFWKYASLFKRNAVAAVLP